MGLRAKWYILSQAFGNDTFYLVMVLFDEHFDLVYYFTLTFLWFGWLLAIPLCMIPSLIVGLSFVSASAIFYDLVTSYPDRKIHIST